MPDAKSTSIKTQATAGIKWTTASAVATTGLQVLQLAILARLLLPEDFGLMAMVMLVIGFGQAYADAGISAAIIHRQDATSEQLTTLYWLNIFAGVLVLLVFWLMIPLVVFFFKEPKLTPLLKVVSITFLIIPLGKQFEILLQKELSFNILAKQQIAASLFGAIVAVACAVLGQGVWALVWGNLGKEALRAAILVVIGWKRFRPKLHFNPNHLQGYLSFGLYQMGERSINFLSSRMDQLLIGSLLGAQPLGYYNFAFNLVIQPVSLINPIVTKVALPVFAKVQKDLSRLQYGYLEVLKKLTTVNAPILIGISTVAPLAVPLIFGRQWNPAVILIQILAFVTLSRSAGNPVGSLLLSQGRADLGFKWNLGLVIIAIPAVCLGVKLGGSVGAALSLLILQIILHFPAYAYLVKPLIGKCAKMYFWSIFKPICVAAGMGLMVIITTSIFIDLSDIVLFGVDIMVGISSYLLLLWLFDRKTIKEIILMIGPQHA